MDTIEQFKKLNTRTSLAISLFFIGLIAPGFLTLYLFKPVLLLEMDTSKVLVFSIAISAPGLILPFFISLITSEVVRAIRPEKAVYLDGYLDWYGIHTVTNSFTFYIALWFSYMFSYPFRTFIIWISVMFLLNAFFEFFRIIKLAKGKMIRASIFRE